MITICSIVDTVLSGNFSCYLELYDTNSSLIGSGLKSLQYTFSNTGTYYLFITDYKRNGTGVYRFILKKGDISCADIDLEKPTVNLLIPRAGDIIESGSTCTISWNVSDNKGITTQEIRLSTDSGATYPVVIATGLSASTESYQWPIPQDLFTAQARLKVIAWDASGNQGEGAHSNDFMIINTVLPNRAKDISYEYDVNNQLTRSTSTVLPTLTYSYDALGNRLSLDVLLPPEAEGSPQEDK